MIRFLIRNYLLFRKIQVFYLCRLRNMFPKKSILISKHLTKREIIQNNLLLIEEKRCEHKVIYHFSTKKVSF